MKMAAYMQRCNFRHEFCLKKGNRKDDATSTANVHAVDIVHKNILFRDAFKLLVK